MRFALLIAAIVSSQFASAGNLAEDVTNNLYGMKAIYSAQYAPAEWKLKYAGYDLNQEFTKGLSAIQSNPSFDMKAARGVLKDFVYSMRDYHTSIQFIATESATLPLVVKSVGDRFFIVEIDRTKLSASTFPFHVGDELKTFGGVDTKDAVAAVQASTIENVAATDKALAELYLTSRRATRGFDVPDGPIVLGIARKGSDPKQKPTQIELLWDHKAELVTPRPSFQLDDGLDQPRPASMFHPMMTVEAERLDSPYGLGARKTFTPDLGTKLWETSSDNAFYAYMYMTPDRKVIGYLRLAGYIMPDYKKAVTDFAAIISHFEKNTDSMIIDQVNNPGGSVFYLYALASMLTDQPLRTPLHRMSITQANVLEALTMKAQYSRIQTEEDAQKALTIADTDGYPASLQFVQFNLRYAQFIIDQWNMNHKLSEPYWIGGVNQINPAKDHYTKPILLLTNHLDFSGGDFFPAIMQDNNRVTIMGSRTAGAGGYIIPQQITNNIGVLQFSVTGSIAERVSGNPIENLGIKPDIDYELTVEDYTSNYAPYVKAIQEAAKSLIK